MTEEKLERANHIVSRMKYLKDTFIEPYERSKIRVKELIDFHEELPLFGGTHIPVSFKVSEVEETIYIPLTIILESIETEIKENQEELDKLKKEFKEL
jgi:hypothetical protein